METPTDRAMRIEEIFEQALQRGIEERAAFLDAACAGNSACRTAVEALLADEDDDFLKPLSDVIRARAPAESLIGEWIGRHRLKRVLATSRLSDIYVAEQDSPRRDVVVKLIRAGARASLEFEAECLGRLEHPNIARIYEAGRFGEGPNARTFFVMKYVAGRPLLEHVEQGRLGLRRRLDLFVRVCRGVEYAHHKGVIHCDLKPSNILVDELGEPKVLDFGIARLTETEPHDDQWDILGTPAYMSPEQLRGGSAGIDARSDVYALGVILYEMLAGEPPYDVRAVSIREAADLVRERQPRRLSSLDAALGGDLELVVAKALEKDEALRYQSASELAADIDRYLRNEPVTARPWTRAYLTRTFVRRNKGIVLSTAIGLAAVLVGMIVSTRLAIVATRARNAEIEQRLQVEEAREAARASEKCARLQSYRAIIAAAAAALRERDPVAARQRLQSAPPEYRGWEWQHLHAQTDTSLRILEGHDGPVTCLAFSPDGLILASGSLDGRVRLWDPYSGGEIDGGAFAHDVGVSALTFGIDGTRLISGCVDGSVHVWNVITGQRIERRRDHEQRINGLAYEPTFRWIASASDDRSLHVWSDDGGSFDYVGRHDAELTSIAFRPDSLELLATPRTGRVAAWDLFASCPATQKWHRHTAHELALAPDGRRVATASGDRTVQVRGWPESDLRTTLNGHTGPVLSVCFSPDGSWIASGSDDTTVRVWHSETGERLAVHAGHLDTVTAVKINPEGTLIASASKDATVRLWSPERFEAVTVLRGHSDYVYAAAFSPDGRIIASGAWDSTIRLWDAESGRELDVFSVHGGEVTALSFSPDSKHIASASGDGVVRIWSLETGGIPRRIGEHEAAAYDVAFSADGRRIASASWDGTVRIWNAETGEQVARYPHDVGVNRVAYSPDGSRFASGALGGELRLWSVHDGEPDREIPVAERHTQDIHALAFRSDGKQLASASGDGTVLLWNTSTGSTEGTLLGHTKAVYGVAYSPDSRRIVTASEDRTIRLWDAATGEVMAELRGHEGYVHSVSFSPDGTKLISASGDGTVRVWDSVILRDRSR